MKKNIGRKGISLCIAVSLLLAGCSSSEEVNRTDEITVSEETQEPETNTTEMTKVSNTTSESDTDSTTTTTTTTTTAETTTTEKVVTTPVTESVPVPEWTENAINKTTMYVNTNGIYSRKKALQGSTAVKQYALNTAVTVVALTDTDYYKLTDGTYIHKDYLSLEKVSVTTTTTSATTTTPPVQSWTVTDNKPEIVFTEELRLEYEKEAARLINEFRVANGLPALEWNETMHQATRIRAEEQLIYPSHDRPNGETYVELLIELGYWDSIEEYGELARQGLVCSPGECLAWGQMTPQIAVQSWIDSPAHRDNLLYDFPNQMAVGVMYDEDARAFVWVYWEMIDIT